VQTAPAALGQQVFQLTELPLSHVFIAQAEADLPQHIVKPEAGVRVLVQ